MKLVAFGRLVVALAGVCAIGTAGAIDWAQEYATRLRATENLSPMSDGAFGDNLNLFNGTVTFSATDASVPGNNGLPVQFSRSFDPQDWSANLPLGDWDIDAPHIRGVHPDRGSSVDDWAPAARCSTVAVPPTHGVFTATDYWSGTSFRAGGSGGDLLGLNANTDPKLVRPSSTAFKWTTKGQWFFSCLAAPLASGEQSEGFRGVAPDGTQYFFNYMVARDYTNITRKDPSQLYGASVNRKSVRLYATEVRDRHGNWVKYDWTGGKLNRIWSSDEREILITYVGGTVSTVTIPSGTTAPDRTWHYTVTSSRLTTVTNPDNTTWTYAGTGDMKTIAHVPDTSTEDPFDFVQDETYWCWRTYKMVATAPTYSVTSPAGSKATYTFAPTRHGRTNVNVRCMEGDDQNWRTDYNLFALTHEVMSLKTKVITGPAIATQTYSYQYDSLGAGYRPKPGYDEETGATPPPHYKFVTVTEPGGRQLVHRFGKDDDLNEGRLLVLEVKKGGVVHKTVTNNYVTEEEIPTQPFPDTAGSNFVALGDGFTAGALRPIRSTVTTLNQQGVSFTHLTNSFDAQARALSVTKSSTLAGNPSRTEVTAYHDRLDKWVLGQVESVTCTAPASSCGTGGKVMSSTAYHQTSVLPIEEYAFGKLQRTLVYNADGTLWKVADGRGSSSTITLSDWKRGIPQAIQHPVTPDQPSGTTQSAVVNHYGWIDSVTDENGYTTGYGYDGMGRLTLVNYPDGDTPNWTSTTRNFSVQGAKYGLPSHWRLAEATGNGIKTIRYDSLWRPVIEETHDSADPENTRSLVVKRYDDRGRLAFQSYPLRDTTNLDFNLVVAGTYTYYDALDRPTLVRQTSELGNLDTTTQYLSGFKTRVVLPKYQGPNPTIYTDTTYQAWDQPTTEFPKIIAQPEGALTTIDRDAFGKPLSITRSGVGVSATRSYAYNANHELCRSIEPETGATLYGYDGAGNLAWSAAGLAGTPACGGATPPAAVEPRTVYRTYDARNRLENLSFPDGNGDQDWSYWPDGLPKIVKTWNIQPDDGTAKETQNNYVYNKRRLLTTESVVVPAWYGFNVGYDYNANGHVTATHYPSGLAVHATVNALGQPRALSSAVNGGGAPYATGITYYPNGAVDEFAYGNLITHKMTQNDRQLPATSRDAYGSTEFLEDSYTYDANGNVTKIDDTLTANRSDRTMIYDDLDRLTDVTSPMYGSTGAHYTYNALDDLTRVQVGGTAARDHHYCYDARRQLTNVKTISCSGATVTGLEYDLQGNLSKKNERRYVFDYGNRLREVLDVERYRYDAHGRRVLAMAFATGVVRSQYGVDGKLLYQRNDRTGKHLDHLYLGSSLVAIREVPIGGTTPSLKYQHTDALGSPVVVTDQGRVPIERSEYEPFGKVLNRPVQDGAGYAGHVEDAATGLSYMQQRYYDPAIGRFLSVDPVAARSVGDNFNRYAYAFNNPYKFTDPDGRENALGIVVTYDPYFSRVGSPTTADAKVLDTAQRSVDLTVNAVMNGSDASRKADAGNWTVSANPDGPGKANTIAEPATADSAKVIDTSYGAGILEVLDPNTAYTFTDGVTAVGGDPALLAVGAHELGHGSDGNIKITNEAASEADVGNRVRDTIKSSPDVERDKIK